METTFRSRRSQGWRLLLGSLAALVAACAEPRAQARLDKELIVAVSMQDVEGLRRAAEAGADPNARDPDFYPALAIAASNQWVEGVEVLLAHQADATVVIHKPRLGLKRTPILHLPAANGSLPVVAALLEAGAQVDAVDAEGVTALMSASFMGHRDIVKLLLAKGAKTERAAQSGYTALMYASNAGHASIVRALLAAGANASATDAQQSTPLMFAAQHAHDDVVEVLLAAGADPTSRGAHGLSAIGFARQNGHQATPRLLTGAN